MPEVFPCRLLKIDTPQKELVVDITIKVGPSLTGLSAPDLVKTAGRLRQAARRAVKQEAEFIKSAFGFEPEDCGGIEEHCGASWVLYAVEILFKRCGQHKSAKFRFLSEQMETDEITLGDVQSYKDEGRWVIDTDGSHLYYDFVERYSYDTRDRQGMIDFLNQIENNDIVIFEGYE